MGARIDLRNEEPCYEFS